MRCCTDFHNGLTLPLYQNLQGLWGFVSGSGKKSVTFWEIYVPLVLMAPLLMWPFMLKERWTRLALLACGLLWAAMLAVTFYLSHYVAPMTGLLFFLIVQALRHLYCVRWRGVRVGRSLVAAALIVYGLSSAWALWQPIGRDPIHWPSVRARLVADLKEAGGKHLILVRYGPRHNLHREWVYNGADIDGAPVVWARDMGDEANQELLEYYRDRQVLLLEVLDPEDHPFRLTPYREKSKPRQGTVTNTHQPAS